MPTGLARTATAALALTAVAAAARIDDARAQAVPPAGDPPAPVATPAPVPTPAPSADGTPAPVPSPPAIDPRDDAAWKLYHEAFAALARDDRAAARAAAAQLTLHHPGHPATLQATRALELAAAPRGRAKAGREQPSQGARAELALFQTFHGIIVGVELCLVAECDEPVSYVGLALLGGAAGAAVSLRAHPTSGQRALINSGTAWGAFNAAMVLLATQPDEVSTGGLTLLGGQAAGVGIVLAASTRAPTAGQVGLANSGGQWTLALTGLTLIATEADLDEKQVATTLALAADVGIGVGGYLASRVPRVSRAQTLVIDAAGIVGAVAGGAGGVMITGQVEDRTTAGLAAVGAVLGLGAAAYFTRHWGDDDDDGPTIVTTIAPVRGGGGVVSAHLAW